MGGTAITRMAIVHETEEDSTLTSSSLLHRRTCRHGGSGARTSSSRSNRCTDGGKSGRIEKGRRRDGTGTSEVGHVAGCDVEWVG